MTKTTIDGIHFEPGKSRVWIKPGADPAHPEGYIATMGKPIKTAEVERLRLENTRLLTTLKFALEILEKLRDGGHYVPSMGSAMREARNAITINKEAKS